MVNVGIVGYGYAGRSFHAYLISLVEGLKVTAVATRDEGRRRQAEQEYGVKTYATMDELLEDKDVQLVVIATPHDTHAAMAIQAMNAGKHCVVDKVMCLNAAEAEAMIAASQKNNVLLSVFHNRRWDWDFLTVQQVLRSGLMGEPFLFESSVGRYGAPRRWRAEKKHMGGILHDWGAHLIDQALQLVPSQVTTVFCDISNRHWDTDIGTHAKLLLKFANGVLFQIEMSYLSRAEKPRWMILGERGAFTKYGLDPQEAAMVAGNIYAAQEDPSHRAKVRTEINGVVGELTVETVRGCWTSYYQNISDALNKNAELNVKPEQVRRQIQILDAAMQSAEQQESVAVRI
jgi:scyllo-inositol 2-dehydrogenase (NADP+)